MVGNTNNSKVSGGNKTKGSKQDKVGYGHLCEENLSILVTPYYIDIHVYIEVMDVQF